MRKSVLVLGLLLSTWLTASPNATNDSLNVVNEDLPVKIERSTLRTEMIKAKWVKIQLKNKKIDPDKRLKLLKDLKPIVSKIEKDIRYQEALK